MKHFSLTSKVFGSAALSVCLIACSSAPKSEGPSEAERMAKLEVYMRGMTAAPLASAGDTCSANVRGQPWKVLISKASACARVGQWESVESLAFELSRSDVDSPWGLYYFSLAAEGRKDYPRALWMIEAAIKRSSSKIALYRYQKGRILWSVKPTEAGLVEIEEALKMDSGLLEGHVFLGEARLRSWDLSNAEKHFSAALERKSDYFEALRGIADCKRLKSEYLEAIPYLTRAVSARPNDLKVRLHLAAAYEESKNTELALATYRSLKESIGSGLVKDKPEFDVSEKIRSLEAVTAQIQDQKKQANARIPADKGEKK